MERARGDWKGSATEQEKSRSGEFPNGSGGTPVENGLAKHLVRRYLLCLELTEDAVVGHDRHSVDLLAISHDDEADGEGEVSGTDVVGDESDTVLIQREGPGGLQADLDTADVLEERRGTGVMLAFAGHLSDLRKGSTGGRTAAREPVSAVD